MELIKGLPKIGWKYDVDNIITAQDFTVVYQISKEFYNAEGTTYDWYDVKPGETPESVANGFYKDPSLYWVILVANRIIDRTGWYLTENQLLNYIFDKYYFKVYSDINGEMVFDEELSGQAVYESLYWTGTAENNYTKEVFYSADGEAITVRPHHFAIEDGEWVPFGTVMEDGKEVTPVSRYDYELISNLNRRYIKIPPANLVNSMANALRDY